MTESSLRAAIAKALIECREATVCIVMNRYDDAAHHTREATRLLAATLPEKDGH